jgi:primosomal protein N' (replication factor Y) (superfamily II helicase)
MSAPAILVIALPTPLRRLFDYLPPGYQPKGSAADMFASLQDTPQYTNIDCNQLQPGTRIEVPFGRQQLVGILIEVKSHSDLPLEQLKPATRVLDNSAVLAADIIALCQWAAHYYHHPVGDVIATALPTLLRQGQPAERQHEQVWQATETGLATTEKQLKRAPKQQQALTYIKKQLLSSPQLVALDISRQALKGLRDKGLIEAIDRPQDNSQPLLAETPLTLNQEQQQALDQIKCEGFNSYLLQGATGSGKTEIYLQVIAEVLTQGKQALVLVPEIGLTPQTLGRFQRRFNVPIATLHSGLNDNERLQSWLQASQGEARIVIGTRSAVFTPMPTLGVIIIDEEHDLSFKQQEGFRYSARDLAAIRAQKHDVPLLLGSATPSLETLYNCDRQRFQLLELTQRAGNAKPPTIELQDIRKEALIEGFSGASLEQITSELERGNQVLVFINRRGYAPTLMCHDCGWQANCPNCDARLTVHQQPRHLHCHHCDFQRGMINQCGSCMSYDLQSVGLGTERSEAALQEHFPATSVIRVDRDTTRRKDAMQTIVDEVNKGEPCILVGTQMLAKGHHFPDVTLVVVLDADGGLFSADFRGPERMGQLLTQVAGRAGRAEKSGRVIIQSHLCDHPLLQTLLYEGYSAFAGQVMSERQIAHLPPYRYLTLIRAEDKNAERAFQFLTAARQLAEQIFPSSVSLQYLGPLPAPLEKRNERFRYQLQINAGQRQDLHHLLQQLIPQLDKLPLGRQVRWSLDIDPQDMA